MTAPETAFVLGGGGHRGAFEVGMLKALTEAGIRPDVIYGNSIGSINGAVLAGDPTVNGIARLEQAWTDMTFKDVFPGGLWSKALSAVRQRTYLHGNDELREWLVRLLPTDDFADLEIPFECVAACIEDASERWFSSGSLIDSVLASSAVPGLLPPVDVDGEHFIDGGVVNSIPISRAYASGARTVFVMHVGHVDDPLEVPTTPWDVAVVAFEIARRHRFTADLSMIPDGTTVHVLPTGAPQGRYNDSAKLRYANLGDAEDQIASAHRATGEYLDPIDA